jgi:hypothetical protein
VTESGKGGRWRAVWEESGNLGVWESVGLAGLRLTNISLRVKLKESAGAAIEGSRL